MRFFVGILIMATCGIQGCTFVSPKPKIVVDHQCNTATEFYTMDLRDPSQGGPAILWGNSIPYKNESGIRECGGKDCETTLLAIGRQIAVETLLSVGYILSHNVVAEYNHTANCTPADPHESADARRSIVLEEDLTPKSK